MVASCRQLTDILKENNKKLDDCTIVLSNPNMDMEWTSRLKTIKLLNFESEHQILEVTDPDLANDCQMEPGMIYVYYKPSIVNGYNALQSMANVNMFVS